MRKRKIERERERQREVNHFNTKSICSYSHWFLLYVGIGVENVMGRSSFTNHHSSLCHFLITPTSSPTHQRLLGGEEEGHDQAVETQDFGENEDENHADKETRLLGSPSHASIAHNSDSIAGCQTAEAHAQASAQMLQ
jgi:hypothetical protein